MRQGVDVLFHHTNGTLLTPADGEFFERLGFAVTIVASMASATHDRLRQFKDGAAATTG